MPRPIRDLTGQRFGKLLVIGFRGMFGCPRKRAVWTCKCDCGRNHLVRSGPLLSGSATSCGCIRAEKNRRRSPLIEFNGQQKHQSEWEREFCLGKGYLSQRLSAGWTIERALTQPVQGKRDLKRTP